MPSRALTRVPSTEIGTHWVQTALYLEKNLLTSLHTVNVNFNGILLNRNAVNFVFLLLGVERRLPKLCSCMRAWGT